VEALDSNPKKMVMADVEDINETTLPEKAKKVDSNIKVASKVLLKVVDSEVAEEEHMHLALILKNRMQNLVVLLLKVLAVDEVEEVKKILKIKKNFRPNWIRTRRSYSTPI
jgi:hypothetical protein